MHVLTKVFVVLVSLLSVLLVPLVVVYAHNENTFKSRWESAEAKAASASVRLNTAQVAHLARELSLQSEINERDSAAASLIRERAHGLHYGRNQLLWPVDAIPVSRHGLEGVVY